MVLILILHLKCVIFLGTFSDSTKIENNKIVSENASHHSPNIQQSAIKRSIMLGLGSGLSQSFSFMSNVERPARPIDPDAKIKRPKVLHRKRGVKSGTIFSPINWGEQSVDMFEVITQIGEGTYGQVYKAKNKSTGNLIKFFS